MAIPVSVVIPCYKCTDTVHQVVQSILDQTVRPSEIILVDDASADGTKEVIAALAEKHRPFIKSLSLERNGGPGIARNAGWAEACQPWIAFLDADDVWHPRKLEVQWDWIEAHPDAVLCGHRSEFIQQPLPEIPESIQSLRLSGRQMLISNRLPTRSVMIKRDLPFRFQGKEVTEDYLLWLQIVLAGYPSYLLDACLAFSLRPEFSPGGYSGQLWKHEKRELNALNVLYKEHLLGRVSVGLWSIWSYFKYLRRECRMRLKRA